MVNILPETEVRVSLIDIPRAEGEGYIVSKLTLTEVEGWYVHHSTPSKSDTFYTV